MIHFRIALRGQGSICDHLNLGRYRFHHRSLIANKFKSSMEMLLFLLFLTGVGVFMMGCPFRLFFPFLKSSRELFMTIFNIHFFYPGSNQGRRRLSGPGLKHHFYLSHSLYACIKGLMTWLPSVRVESFLLIELVSSFFSLFSSSSRQEITSKRRDISIKKKHRSVLLVVFFFLS